jgi:hypothetical protein
MRNKIILILVLVFAVMQLFTIDKVPFKEPGAEDLFSIESAPDEVKDIILSTCYDCHSNQVNYPWYSEIAPVSWWVQDHIEEGREHLNFSAWGNYPAGKKAHKAEEAYEEIEEEEMPLPSYVFAHSEARLNEEQKQLLIKWFKSLEEKHKANSKG